MARPGLTRHRKFTRLARLVGSRALAFGTLGLLWEVAYEAGDGNLGDAGDVEHAADWQGEPGKLVAALVAAGFIDKRGRTYHVHDLYDHAPEYVRRRMDREQARITAGANISEIRARAAKARWDRAKSDANGGTVASVCNANGTPPTPTPTPTPTPLPASQSDQGSVLSEAGLAGDDLGGFREKLASALGVPTVDVGKDREGVLRVFHAQIAAEGEACVLADCTEAARRSKNGIPRSLAWFVGWLQALPLRPMAQSTGGDK